MAAWIRLIVQRVVLARFDTIDYKMSFLMEELTSRTDALSQKIDESLWAISEKLDRPSDQGNAIVESRLESVQSDLARLASEVERLASTVRYGQATEHEILAQTQALRDRLSEAAPSYPPVVSSSSSSETPAVLATFVDGMIIGVPATEWRVAAHHTFRGVMQPGMLRLFRSLVKPGMIVADVGANVGVFTVTGARSLDGLGRIFSYEPSPEVFKILRANVQVNGFLESEIVRFSSCAVTDHVGVSSLTVFPDDSGHSTLFWPDRASDSIAVDTTTLDHDLRLETRVDLVKIDAEGAERLVWNGMRQIVSRDRDIQILMEFAPTHLHRAGVNPGDFLEEISSLGFNILRINDVSGELVHSSRSDLCSAFSANLFLTRDKPREATL
ncbi:MAG: FkbM family methyltransferase [Bryobacteraceae bacterium]